MCGPCPLVCCGAGALQGSREQGAAGAGFVPPALRAYLLRASVTMRFELDYGALTSLQLQSPGTFLPDVQRWNARCSQGCARLLVSQAGSRRPACRAKPLQRGTRGSPAHCAKGMSGVWAPRGLQATQPFLGDVQRCCEGTRPHQRAHRTAPRSWCECCVDKGRRLCRETVPGCKEDHTGLGNSPYGWALGLCLCSECRKIPSQTPPVAACTR